MASAPLKSEDDYLHTQVPTYLPTYLLCTSVENIHLVDVVKLKNAEVRVVISCLLSKKEISEITGECELKK